MTDKPKVVQFPGGNLADIPRGLRSLADDIEKIHGMEQIGGQEVGRVMNLVWVWIDDTGDTAVGALGRDIDKWRAAGLCQHAITNLLTETGG